MYGHYSFLFALKEHWVMGVCSQFYVSFTSAIPLGVLLAVGLVT